MSSHFSVYVGPYLYCSISKDKAYIEKTKQFKCCVNPHCKLLNKELTDFFKPTFIPKCCPDCGKEIGMFEKTYSIPKVYSYDVSSAVNEKLTPVDIDAKHELNLVDLYIANISCDIARSFHLECGDYLIDLYDYTIFDEKQSFKSFFQNEIKTIESYYDSVSINWGILSYMV